MTRRRAPRILQVVLSLNPGGTERLVVDLVTRLQAEIPMAVCCLDTDGAWAEQVRAVGASVTSLGRQPGFRPALGLAIAGIARRHRATAIHAHHYSPFVYSAVAKLRTPGTHVVFTEHGRVSDAPPSAKRRLANRVLATLPSRVFAVSDDLRQYIVAEGFGREQVEVIYNGISLRPPVTPAARETIRQRLGADSETLVIGTVARLDPVKDLGTLVDAVGRLSQVRSVRLVVVGDGPERATLEQRAAAAGTTSVITWLGHRDDARDWLAGCDAYVNCSISEGVSLTILEAMAAGLPVVATRVGGTPEVVTTDTGLLVPARDMGAIVHAIDALAGDPARRTQFGTAARARVETHFSLDRMIAQYRNIYEEYA